MGEYNDSNYNNQIFSELECKIGQQVLIFTRSGGVSGSGFSGTLISANENVVRLLTTPSSIPNCPLSESCLRDKCNDRCNDKDYCDRFGTICLINTRQIVSIAYHTI